MKNLQLFKKWNTIVLIVLVLFIGSCQKDDLTDNGLENKVALDPSFVITPVSGENNTYNFVAKRDNIMAWKWNLGGGTSDFFGQASMKIFYPDAGNYTIVNNVMGKGGIYVSSNQMLNVPVSDPISGNLVRGGKFLNAAEHNEWTILNIAGTHVKWNFGAGFASITGTSSFAYAQQGIYQAIQVEANKKYVLDMNIMGTPCKNTWFEAYVGSAVPTQNQEYSDGGKRMGFKTFDNCGMSSAFDGKLSVLRCEGSGNIIQFPTARTVYLVIRSGGFGDNTLGISGVRVTNVEFRGQRE